MSVRSLPGPQRTLRAKVLPRVALQLALAFSSTLGGEGWASPVPRGSQGALWFSGADGGLENGPTW